MLEVRKNTFSKNYENAFFREFARHLSRAFNEQGLEGVLIGSPVCEVDERLQIDALLLTPSVICIIDFKNYKGKVRLPNENDFEFGLWTNETGEHIKGGSSINPFIQLKNQKRKFIEVTSKYIQKEIPRTDSYNPFHVVKVVCFQGDIELTGKIPGSEELNFFILNRTNIIEGILDIVDVVDKEVKLSKISFDLFKKVFRADLFTFDDKPLEDKLREVVSTSTKLDFSILYDDQKAALTAIKSFLENDDDNIFILQGTLNSGKTHLIPYIQHLAANRESYIFAASNRIAQNLLSSDNKEEIMSMYSSIYGGQRNEVSNSSQDARINESILEVESEDNVEEVPIEIENISLKACPYPENAIFIVDESQLVSDSYYQSIDLIFGSGYLLRDFLEYAKLNHSQRKVIFIGDPYQLQLGKTDESPLNPAHLEEAYKLKVTCFQLLDKPNYSNINKQALTCVQSLKANLYNSLRFEPGKQFSFLKKEEVSAYISNLIVNKIDVKILTYSNEEAQKVNNWIKNSIVKTGSDIQIGDLVLFNNNISIENESDPFAATRKIYNGQFATVTGVSKKLITQSIKLKGKLLTVNFREVQVLLNDTRQHVKVLSLENYRLSPKAELSRDELTAYNMLLNSEIGKYLKEHSFEQSLFYSEVMSQKEYQQIQSEIDELERKGLAEDHIKQLLKEKNKQKQSFLKTAKQKYRMFVRAKLLKDPTSNYYKYKNAALLKFGWAITVHKSMSNKWDEVVLNVNPGEIGRANSTHFRWLYTGLSRARNKVSLINYTPISPFYKTVFRDSNASLKPKNLFFFSESPSLEAKLEELSQLVARKLSSSSYKVITKEKSVNGSFRFKTFTIDSPNSFGSDFIIVGTLNLPSFL